jgi:hypothetical protein
VSKFSGLTVKFVLVQSFVQKTTLSFGERNAPLLCGYAVPKILDELQSLFERQILQFCRHIRVHLIGLTDPISG